MRRKIPATISTALSLVATSPCKFSHQSLIKNWIPQTFLCSAVETSNAVYRNRISSLPVPEPDDDVKKGRVKRCLGLSRFFLCSELVQLYIYIHQEDKRKTNYLQYFVYPCRQLISQDFSSSKEDEAIDEVCADLKTTASCCPRWIKYIILTRATAEKRIQEEKHLQIQQVFLSQTKKQQVCISISSYLSSDR